MSESKSEGKSPAGPVREPFHLQSGAVYETLAEGVIGPAHYGSVEEEVGRLREGCALSDRVTVDRLTLTGEDRKRLLNGLMTCNVKDLADGSVTYGFFTDGKGRILADGKIVAAGEELRLEVPSGSGESLRGHIQRHVVADRVEIGTDPDSALFTLAGPGAERFLIELLCVSDLPAAGAAVCMSVLGREVVLVGEPRLGTLAWTLWVAHGDADDLLGEIAAAATVPILVGYRAMETVRVERGIPRFGIDFGPENFPQETGQEDAVSYEKGCYLGQEVVARIHFRGGVNKQLRGLELGDGGIPAGGTEIRHDGREVGRVSSSVYSPTLARGIALAIIDNRVEPGMTVAVSGSGEARVVDLPFVTGKSGPA